MRVRRKYPLVDHVCSVVVIIDYECWDRRKHIGEDFFECLRNFRVEREGWGLFHLLEGKYLRPIHCRVESGPWPFRGSEVVCDESLPKAESVVLVRENTFIQSVSVDEGEASKVPLTAVLGGTHGIKFITALDVIGKYVSFNLKNVKKNRVGMKPVGNLTIKYRMYVYHSKTDLGSVFKPMLRQGEFTAVMSGEFITHELGVFWIPMRGVKDLLIAVRGEPLTHIQFSLSLAPPHMKEHILSILNITL